MEAKAFYTTIALATLLGVLMNFSPINPIKALFWTAVINGVVAVPVMVVMMLLVSNRKVMHKFAIGSVLKAVGWTATLAMTVAAVAMAFTAI